MQYKVLKFNILLTFTKSFILINLAKNQNINEANTK